MYIVFAPGGIIQAKLIKGGAEEAEAFKGSPKICICPNKIVFTQAETINKRAEKKSHLKNAVNICPGISDSATLYLSRRKETMQTYTADFGWHWEGRLFPRVKQLTYASG